MGCPCNHDRFPRPNVLSLDLSMVLRWQVGLPDLSGRCCTVPVENVGARPGRTFARVLSKDS